MPRKFKGKLNERIARRVVNHLLRPGQRNPILKKHFDEDWEKLVLLCEEYEIPVDENMFVKLTFALAREFVAGFQEKKKRGPKPKWTTSRDAALVVEIEKIRDSQNCSISEAAKKLALKEPWKGFVDARETGDSPLNAAETLRGQYNNARRSKHIDYNRKHLTGLRDAYAEQEWETHIRELFCRE